jgi:hypothetical protein
LKLSPHETRAIDMRKLRDAQIADFRKNVIPAGATDGSVSWIRLDNLPVSGRVVVISRNGGTASGYDCGDCVCSDNFTRIDISAPKSVTLTPNHIAQCGPTLASYEDCNGWVSFYDVTGEASWSSNNTPVATVAYGNIYGVAGGTATATATYRDWEYWNGFDCNPNTLITSHDACTVKVQVPTSLEVLTVSVLPTGTSGDYGCTPSDDYGIKVKTTYRVLDQNSPPLAILKNNMEPQETITDVVVDGESREDLQPTWIDIGPTPISGTSKFTNSSGQFIDAPYGGCYHDSFSEGWLQTISILVGGQRYYVRTNVVTMSGYTQGHGSITNGSDIIKSR